MLDALPFKLHMFSVPINGPAIVLFDNKSVVTNSSMPKSSLEKKNYSIAYHRACESVATRKIIVYYESTDSNIADLMINLLLISV